MMDCLFCGLQMICNKGESFNCFHIFFILGISVF